MHLSTSHLIPGTLGHIEAVLRAKHYQHHVVVYRVGEGYVEYSLVSKKQV